MLPFGIGTTELIVVLILVLFFYGAGRLPEIGRSMGRAITEFKHGVTDSSEERPTPPAERDASGPTRT